MTLLDGSPACRAPAVLPCSPHDLAAALAAAGPLATLVLFSLHPDLHEEHLLDRAARALLRETRSSDWLGRTGETEIVSVVAVSEADRDAVADRLLSVVERASGVLASAGVCIAVGRSDPLALARAGLAVAWACGGSRAVRHP